MKNIETDIIIDAPIEIVWRVLMDFDSYPNWNPFLTVKGLPFLGEKLDLEIEMRGKKSQFRPKVVAYEEGRQFEWRGKLIVSGIFAGNHYFRLKPITEFQTMLIHGENFTGILHKPIMKKIDQATRDGFEAMNVAMKEYAEDQVI
jgi:hypothetical protein